MKPVEDKSFLQFLGKPLIEWQLTQLWQAGFQEIVLVGGKHNLERLHELDDRMPMQIDVVEQENLDEGMMGAVLASEKLIGDEPMLVVSSNDIVDGKAFEIMKKAIGELGNGSENGDGLMLAKKVDAYFPGGYIEINDEGHVSSIVEKPEPGTEPSNLVNLVVHYFAKPTEFIKHLKDSKSDSDDLYEVALSSYMSAGAKLKAIEFDGFWQPVKFPWHIAEVFHYLFGLQSDGEPAIHADAEVSENAIVEGAVIVEAGARIMAGATVKGPCYIGARTIIATNALVRDSNVGADCVIGFSTEVARSHVGDNVWTHSNYIGDSVIGDDVSFGAGTVTGNLRLNEGVIGETGTNKWGLVTGDHIRVGVNTSFMPGVRVGSESYIGAGIVVAEDIPYKSFVRGDWDLKIDENKGTFSSEMREKMRKKL